MTTKRISTSLLILASSLAAAYPAFADNGSDSEILDDVRVTLPYGSSPPPTAASQASDLTPVVPDSERMLLSFDASSWAPSNFTLNSQMPNSTAFGRTVPYLSLDITSPPILEGRAGTLVLRAGVGILAMTRNASVDTAGSPENYSQTAFLVPINLSLEARPSFLQWKKLGFYVDAGLLPTMVFTERSPFDDGRTLFGLPASFLVGGSYDVRGLLRVSTPTYFELGVSQTVGSVSEGSVNGTGILAGVRVAI